MYKRQILDVTIGNHFHWEMMEDQTFHGDLIFRIREDQTIAVINEILLEDYLKGVISSEMNPSSPMEFLKAHAIVSRSWLLSALEKKRRSKGICKPWGRITDEELILWHDREDHDLYDFCADDHCQRYHGISKIKSHQICLLYTSDAADE